MRVRGLKPFSDVLRLIAIVVAPHAGAWIETIVLPAILTFKLVAPHAGAWIETTIEMSVKDIEKASHPMRVRGLKRRQ